MDVNESITTVREVLKYNNIIKSIIDNAKDVNSLVKFKLLGMIKQFENIVANTENIRVELLEKYGETKEDGTVSIMPPSKDDIEDETEYEKAYKDYEESYKKFIEEYGAILDSKIDIQLKKFKSSEIMNMGIPSDYLVALYDLIEE